MSERVALLVMTGFAGSGKTSLLARWLVDPEFAESALVVNELGEAAMDHLLIASSNRPARTVLGGCACCSARSRFAATLEQLSLDRLQRRVPRFGRVVLETSGLAEPAAIIEELESHPVLRGAYRLEGVIATVDATDGLRAIESHRECLSQILAADAIVVTKTDLASPADVDRLEARLEQLNRRAHVMRSVDGNAHPDLVMAAVHGAPARPPGAAGQASRAEPSHASEIRATTLRPRLPIDAEVLRSRVEGFLERYGSRVLRMKGMLAIEGRPGPAVIQAVAGTLYPVRLMTRWPDGSAAALVVLTQGLREADAAAALEEVAPAG